MSELKYKIRLRKDEKGNFFIVDNTPRMWSETFQTYYRHWRKRKGIYLPDDLQKCAMFEEGFHKLKKATKNECKELLSLLDKEVGKEGKGYMLVEED